MYWELRAATLTLSSEGALPCIKEASCIRDQNLLFLRPLPGAQNSAVTCLFSHKEIVLHYTPLTWTLRQVLVLLLTTILIFLNFPYCLTYPNSPPSNLSWGLFLIVLCRHSKGDIDVTRIGDDCK